MTNELFTNWVYNQLLTVRNSKDIDEIVSKISRRENIAFADQILKSIPGFSNVVADAIVNGYKDIFVSG